MKTYYPCVLLGLLSCLGCDLNVDIWHLKSQKTLSELSHNTMPLQFEPPHALVAYSHLPPEKPFILHQITSSDKNGNHRLQLYIQIQNPDKKAFLIDSLITQYQNDFDIIWIFSALPESQTDPQWLHEAAWFSSHIPQSEHHHGIKQARYAYGTYRK